VTGVASKALAARNLRVVNRTEDEAAHIETASPEQKAAAAAKHATWKFQLLETVNADPKTDPYCLAVMVSLLNFCRPGDRTAWMAENEMQVRTGMQPRTLRRAKARLASLGYLTPERRNQKGILIYRIANPRQEMIADHVVFAREAFHEADILKKDRERRRRKRGGSRLTPPRFGEGGANLPGTGGASEPPKSVEQPVDIISSEEVQSLRPDPWGVYEAARRRVGDVDG
jgi:hypothetical protein